MRLFSFRKKLLSYDMLLKTKCITWKPKSPITLHSILLLYIPLLNKYFFLLIIIII